MNYAQAAEQYLGLQEDAGPNLDHAGVITAMLASVGVGPGNSWCAAFVSQCFRDAGAQGFPFSGGSQAIRLAFEDKGLMTHDPQELLNWGGAIGGWTDVADSAHGHVFCVVERFTDKSGAIVGIGTIEGNTGPDGGANGDGCYRKRRELKGDGLFYPVDPSGNVIGPGHELWFCNPSIYRGGVIWQ